MTEQELEAVKPAMKKHAAAAYPNEACGLVVNTGTRLKYMPCENASNEPGDYFAISDDEFARCSDEGEVVCVFHSHPDAAHTPSDHDLASCQRSELPWAIMSWPAGKWSFTDHDLSLVELYGRKFVHGSFDCFGFIQSWFRQNRDIVLPTPSRSDEWWQNGQNLYLDNYEKWGFVRVPEEDMKPGDVLLMQVLSPVPNHSAILIEDDIIGHHLYGRLSSKDVYGGYWRRHTTHVMRYKGAKNAA